MKTKFFWGINALACLALFLANFESLHSDELRRGNANILNRPDERVSDKILNKPEEVSENRVLIKNATVETLLPLPSDESPWLSTFMNRPNFDSTLFPPLEDKDIDPTLPPLVPNFPMLGEAVSVGIKQASEAIFTYGPFMWIRHVPAAAIFRDVAPHWTFIPEIHYFPNAQ